MVFKKKKSDWRDVVKYTANTSGLLDDLPKQDSFEFLLEPTHVVSGSEQRILYVVDWVPSEDLSSPYKKLFSGVTGDLFYNVLNLAKTRFLKNIEVNRSSWRVTSFSAYRTIGKPKSFQENLKQTFLKRLNKTIVEYKPTVVVCLGHIASRYIIQDKYDMLGKIGPWLGVPIIRDFEHESKKHSCLFIASLSLTQAVTGKSEAMLLGYTARHMANALAGRHLYKVDDKALRNHKSILIDTIGKFNKLMDVLERSEAVSIDTETKNLNKVTNRMLTIQFAKCANFGYLVPIYHKDTPFSADELKYIVRRLRSFFEGKNRNKYHIYANAKFDLLTLRSTLKTQYFHNDLWDIFGGEFALDENMKLLDSVVGDYYYSLLNLSLQYGTTVYLDADFGKQDRGSIAHRDLDTALIWYGTLDVVVPFAIHVQQKRRAQDIEYRLYEKVVTKQISDTIHGFTKMEHYGSGVDIDYLFFLRTPGSPIELEIKKMEQDLLGSKAVARANALLKKQKGVASKGLFGDKVADTMYFDLGKNDHKQLLFFEVLDLKPLEFGKAVDANGNKAGKIDATFQKTYADVPEVAQFTAISKAKKLKNAYVKSFVKKLSTSEDFRSDHRIRPTYSYLKVVTYRSSAEDPNLQQIPSRSELGKHIKRLFVARKGCLYIKVDYRVHEVRGWGIVSFDKGIAQVFKKAKDLWDEYRRNPSEELSKRLKFEADIHVVNVIYFFSKKLEDLINDPKMLKDLRNAVKGVTFGLIYQMSLKSLAESIKQTLEYTEKLYDGFIRRFPNAMKWNEDSKKFAQANYYVEAPIGIRRNLWGYVLPKFKSRQGDRNYINTSSVHADMDRRAVNSPVQGLGAQCMSIGNRMLDKMLYKFKVEDKRIVKLYTNNSVHDSLENESGYGDLLLSLDLIERALTDEVKREIKERYGFTLNSDLAIDFEIGACLSDMHTWDFSMPKLERIVKDSLTFQRDVLKHDIDVDLELKNVFSRKEDMPKWMTDQIKTLGFKFEYEQKRQTASVSGSNRSKV